MEGTQQSKMIDQRKNDLLPIDFEKGRRRRAINDR